MNHTVNPQTEKLVYLIQMCVGFIITLVIISGNLCTIIVFVKHQHLRTISNVLLFSLSITDFLCGILSSLSDILLYTDFSCEDDLIFMRNTLMLTVSSSMLHLVCIAIERFIVIQFPLQYNRILTRKVITLMLVITWIISLDNLVFIPFSNCTQYILIFGIGLYVNGVFYVLTTVTICTLYGILICTLQKHRRGSKVNMKTKTSKKGIKILGLLILCFAISWFPFMIYQIIALVGIISPILKLLLNTVTFKFGICNSGVNVFIYAFTLQPFRRAYKKLLSL